MRDAMPLSAIAPAPKSAAFRLNFSETINQKIQMLRLANDYDCKAAQAEAFNIKQPKPE
jgi:hypothetical protein